MPVRHPIEWAQDIGLSCLLAVLGLIGTGPASEDQMDWSREPDGLAFTLVVLAALPFVARRRFPASVLAASATAVLVYLAEGYAFGPIMLTIPVAAYTVGSWLPVRRALPWVGGYYLATYAVVVVRLLDEPSEQLWPGIMGYTVGSLAGFAAPLAVGAAIRIRRESEAGVRAEQARRAISEERLRMAQELHDTVGHGLAVIAMQAGVALHVLERSPEKVREALEAIQVTSRESLDGLRAELEMLRSPDGDEVPRRPGLGLADVEVLFERIRTGGIGLETEIDIPDVHGVPPEVDVAVYRILQESLTNVLRHAAATTAWVRVRLDGEHVVVEVTDDGTGAHQNEPVDLAGGVERGGGVRRGSGIAGMRVRASSLGGQLEAGPRPEGGFAVRARLPLSPASVPSRVSGSAS